MSLMVRNVSNIIQIVRSFDIDPSHITISEPQLPNEYIVHWDKVSQLYSTPLLPTKTEKQNLYSSMTNLVLRY